MSRIRRSVRALEPLQQNRTTVPLPQERLERKSYILRPQAKIESSSTQQLEQSKTDRDRLKLRAKHYLAGDKLVDHPETTFALCNIINEERRRLEALPTQNTHSSFNSYQTSPTKQFQETHRQDRSHICHERKEVIELASWLDSKLEGFRNKNRLELSDIIEYKQTVVNLGLGQLLKMVERSCKEEASLLKALWDSTFDIFEGLLRILTKHCEDQDKTYLQQATEQVRLYEQQLTFEREKLQKAKQENKHLLDRLKQLIGNHRRLRRDKKRLSLQHRITGYTLQSYQESYTVLLEMTLQSNDGNIVAWARKMMSRLLKDKRRKKKNFRKNETDKEVYHITTRAVIEWLRKNDENCQNPGLEVYESADYDREVQMVCLETHRPSKCNQSPGARMKLTKDCQTSNKDIDEVAGYTSINELNESSTSDHEDIYSYFKCYDVGTQVEVDCVEVGMSTGFAEVNAQIQTDDPEMVDAAVVADFVAGFATLGDIMTNIADMDPHPLNDDDSKVSIDMTESQQNRLNQSRTDSSFSNQIISATTRRISRQPVFEEAWMKNRARISGHNHNKERKRMAMIANPSSVNLVKIAAYDTASHDGRRMGFRYSNTQSLAGQSQPFPITRRLKLRKFSEVFTAEKQRMLLNFKQHIRRIEQNRSFYCLPINEQSIFQNEHIRKRKLIMTQRCQLASADYSQASKLVRSIYEQDINVIKHRTFKQNQQILAAIQVELKPQRIRQQKVKPTYNTVCKVMSYLIMDYVRLVKKETEEVNRPMEKFFYPLNVLYVDRFLHIYGLKEIAERNMRNNLNHIISLSPRFEKVRLFKELLEADSSGFELEQYIRCLVYLDISGNVCTNQTSMKEFNIDRLSTNMETVRIQFTAISQSANLQAVQRSQILEQLEEQAKRQPSELTIEYVALLLIFASRANSKRLAQEYLPQYSLITSSHSNDPISSYMQLLRQCRISYDNEVQVVRLLASNLDVLEDNGRTISQQRFLSLCISCRFPTVSQITEYFWSQLQKTAVSADTKGVLLSTIDLSKILHIADQWRVTIPHALLSELNASVEVNGLQPAGINRFWWGMLLHTVFSTHLQATMVKIIPELQLTNVQTYGLKFATKL